MLNFNVANYNWNSINIKNSHGNPLPYWNHVTNANTDPIANHATDGS